MPRALPARLAEVEADPASMSETRIDLLDALAVKEYAR